LPTFLNIELSSYIIYNQNIVCGRIWLCFCRTAASTELNVRQFG